MQPSEAEAREQAVLGRARTLPLDFARDERSTGTHQEQNAVLHTPVCASTAGPCLTTRTARMIDKSRPEGQAAQAPDFLPVPRQRERFDGWTPERQRGFIDALARTGSVKAAAHAVNMTPEGAYLLRRHAEAGEFRKAWKDALALGVQRLEDIAMERALHGIEVPVYHFGEIVGTRRVFNDSLLMFLLRNRSRKRFAADAINSGDAATRSQLKRLKEQWRKEWEEEKRAESSKSSQEIIESINRKLSTMRDRRRAMMSPRTRRLHALYEQSARLDQQRGRQYPVPEETDEYEDDV
jgi:hypothetical protein